MSFNFEDFKAKYKLHEEGESYLKQRAEDGTKPYYELSVEDARAVSLENALKYGGTMEFEGTTKDFIVPSPYCTDGIPVTVYRAKTCDLVSHPAVLVYFHGGGNVVGSRKTHETICKIISRDAQCVVVNVEYRLGPENRFPDNHNDARCAVRWAAMNKSLIGAVNDSVVGVGGDSAGGRLSATVSFEVPSIKFQVLVYPNVDQRPLYPSMEEFETGPVLSKKVREWFKDNYISEEDYSNPRASPILQKDFSKLPPALIIVAELDPLRDSCYAYYEKLKQAGVKAEILRIKGVPHAFFNLPGHYKETCRKATEKIAKFIKAHSWLPSDVQQFTK